MKGLEDINVPGATILRHDAYDEKFANRLGKFDIIIDDGPHSVESWKALVKLYLPKVKQGGLFVIEDFWAEPTDIGAPENYEIIDLRSRNGRGDDRLLVIRYGFREGFCYKWTVS